MGQSSQAIFRRRKIRHRDRTELQRRRPAFPPLRCRAATLARDGNRAAPLACVEINRPAKLAEYFVAPIYRIYADRSSRSRHTRFRQGEQVATWSIKGSSIAKLLRSNASFRRTSSDGQPLRSGFGNAWRATLLSSAQTSTCSACGVSPEFICIK